MLGLSHQFRFFHLAGGKHTYRDRTHCQTMVFVALVYSHFHLCQSAFVSFTLSLSSVSSKQDCHPPMAEGRGFTARGDKLSSTGLP
jgi:hypothetical protein